MCISIGARQRKKNWLTKFVLKEEGEKRKESKSRRERTTTWERKDKMVYLWRSSSTGTLTFLCTFFCSLRFVTLISYNWLKPRDIDYGTGKIILFMNTTKKKETCLRYKASSSSLTFMVSGRDVVVVVAVVFVCVVVAINILVLWHRGFRRRKRVSRDREGAVRRGDAMAPLQEVIRGPTSHVRFSAARRRIELKEWIFQRVV